MKEEEIRQRIRENELKFLATRSSGPGGQNVNKVNTRIELRFNVIESDALSAGEKELILNKLKNRINSMGVLLIVSQSERTQLGNKNKAEELFYKLVSRALRVNPPRKDTKPTKASKIKRVEGKKRRGLIKSMRKETPSNED